jgi:hypothetical protein
LQNLKLRLGPVAGSSKHANMHLCTKYGQFLDLLNDCYILKKDSIPWSLSKFFSPGSNNLNAAVKLAEQH